jgi:hypothetical protein
MHKANFSLLVLWYLQILFNILQQGANRGWRNPRNEKLHNFWIKFSTNTASELSLIIHRPELQDSIKIRLKEKAYKDNDYIYGEHDITSGGIVDMGMNFRAELKKNWKSLSKYFGFAVSAPFHQRYVPTFRSLTTDAT